MKYVFYKIINKSNDKEFYIGSTKNFTSRKSHHKKNVNNRRSKKYWCKLYQYIRTNGNWDNFEMVIICQEEMPTKQDALKKEQQLINELNPTLNSIKACKNIDLILIEY